MKIFVNEKNNGIEILDKKKWSDHAEKNATDIISRGRNYR